MSDPSDYTIGWICAITTEYVAAQLFLDEAHEPPKNVSTNDNNDYALGRIGKHNIVIAVLPLGEYGISSAAGVAKDMLHSFPNVRVGLMVGIGGGAPTSKNDIRLGDVVVSCSNGSNGAVFQYDFGKAVQGQEFQETGFLNQPPAILRAAVNGLSAQYEINGHNIDASINEILSKKPKLKRKYGRPLLRLDRLYNPEVVHPPNDPSDCLTVCGDDVSKLKTRIDRSEDEDNPMIHCGLIASSNNLMKNALIRDALAAKKGVLCFEMEAAGLMNHFPFLVIRGICDYSDSHKNKNWQGYAAMTAAAYAKDLLYRLAPTQVEAEKKIMQIISGISQKADTIIRNQEKSEYEYILKWLTEVNYGPQHSDYLARRQPGTGQWLLDTEQFIAWCNACSQTLFCPGKPGAGKTILTSIVIDKLEKSFYDDGDIGVAYIYCDFRRQDEQTARGLLESLLKQLAQGLSTFPKEVKGLHKKHKNNQTRASWEEILTTLRSVTKYYAKVFIIIDALDECEEAKGLLAEVFKLQTKFSVNIFATSRFIPEITALFHGSTSLEIRATREDVKKYISGHITRLPSCVQRSPELRQEVAAEIVGSVKGMFLLAKLYLESLVGKISVKAVRSALRKLRSGSNTYDIAYEEAMNRIERQTPDHRDLAKRVISWIICAKRPLSIAELRHALAVETDAPELDEDALPEIEDIVMVCVGLVTVDEKSNVIRLVHYTAQQYFSKTREIWFPEAEADIFTTCITYMSFDIFGRNFCQNNRELSKRLIDYPFYDYSAKHWGCHAHEASEFCQKAIDFLESDIMLESSCQVLMGSNGTISGRISPKKMTGLHMVAYFGITNLAQILISRNSMHLKSPLPQNEIVFAARPGYTNIKKGIVDARKFDPNRGDSQGKTPLAYAAERNHEDIVKLLLQVDTVNPNIFDIAGKSPLAIAAYWGNEAVVKLLLQTDKVDLNTLDTAGRSPLAIAAYWGREAIVRLLLQTDKVDPNTLDTAGKSTLAIAIDKRRGEIIKLLLRADKIDLNIKDYNDRTVLASAVYSGNKAIVKLLLQEDKVDPNIKDNDGRTALALSAYWGNESIVKLLLQADKVDPNIKDKDGRTVLASAVGQGNKAIVKLLLQTNRFEPNIKDAYGRTALASAIYSGKEAIVKLLLQADKVDPNVKDNDGRTALALSAYWGNESIVKLLLQADKVDPNIKDNDDRTALELAVIQGHEEVVKLLLQFKF